MKSIAMRMSAASARSIEVTAAAMLAVFAAMAVPQRLSAQDTELPGLSIELIDPKAFRVCADPRNMPFSAENLGGSSGHTSPCGVGTSMSGVTRFAGSTTSVK